MKLATTVHWSFLPLKALRTFGLHSPWQQAYIHLELLVFSSGINTSLLPLHIVSFSFQYHQNLQTYGFSSSEQREGLPQLCNEVTLAYPGTLNELVRKWRYYSLCNSALHVPTLCLQDSSAPRPWTDTRLICFRSKCISYNFLSWLSRACPCKPGCCLGLLLQARGLTHCLWPSLSLSLAILITVVETADKKTVKEAR